MFMSCMQMSNVCGNQDGWVGGGKQKRLNCLPSGWEIMFNSETHSKYTEEATRENKREIFYYCCVNICYDHNTV
jgi:hypothetical protein